MPELPLGALRAEREQFAATVRPPSPPLRDREQLVNLAAALGAEHGFPLQVGELTSLRFA
jgi:hypothetical protein